MTNHFTHLHVHTDYSLLDGAITIDRLIAFGKKHNLKALAITDHGNIFGAVKFFQSCKKTAIKPILGIETYFTEDVSIKEANKKYYHLILLVKNAIGYKNLCKLISYSFQKGFYFKPRIDYHILEQHADGLIATSACLGGHIPQLLINDELDKAYLKVDWFLKTFGEHNFYLEIQPEDQKEQTVLNEKLYFLNKKKGVPLVATADCHYVNEEDREAHEVMLCVQTQHKISDPDRFSFGDCRVHLRDTQTMLNIFKDHQEAVWNTGDIADRCSFEFETGKLFLPKFEIPKTQTPESYFKSLCEQGLQNLINASTIDPSNATEYRARLQIEIELITKMNFVGYFLIVSDFIKWAKQHHIPVGPGRGSVAGSLVAWTLQITDIDPLKYNLLFERFLNPERITMPDIDIDFCIEGREKVINYVRDTYGHNKVGQIITFGTMLAKGVIKDVARVLGMPFEDSNRITQLIPNQLKITLKEAVEQESKLQELIATNPHVQRLFDLAYRIEGLTRHASKHAAGIVISPEPIDEVLPIYIPSRSSEIVTQYAMSELETLGFLKMDFLGLKNLTLIDKTTKLIKKLHTITITSNSLPMNDTKTFKLLQRGDTSGVFQLESSGLKEVLRKLQPEKFEDVIAVNALYRPGPLGSGIMVDDFIERKHGRAKISYIFPELQPILEETYGVIVYQEQVMKIASAIAGYSLGEADILRRAMGKKKAEVMKEQQDIFVTRAVKRGFNQTLSQELFDLMAYFAGYGFNKSHSAAYSLITYQTAYLKAHYPAEFMACLLSLEAAHAEKMAFYLEEVKDMGVKILPPSINTSVIDFSVKDNAILFGLKGIKNVGLAALEHILEEREKEHFTDILDFCTRVDLRTSNKRVIESLICAGALDELPGTRTQKYNELDSIIDHALVIKKSKETGQLGLFHTTHSHTQTTARYSFQSNTQWSNKETLEKEREVVGFYLSAHPLDIYSSLLKCLTIHPFNTNAVNNSTPNLIVGCGLKKTIKTITTKKGDRMAFLHLEDTSHDAEIVIFPKLFLQVAHWLNNYDIFLVKGIRDETTAHACKIKAQELVPLELLFQEWKQFQQIEITLPFTADQELITYIQNVFQPGKTPIHIIFYEQGKKLKLISKKLITINESVIDLLQKKEVEIKLQC